MPTKRAASPSYVIHPHGDTTKCVGVTGGVFAQGTVIDIYDCNGSATQQWFGSDPRMLNPADGSEWALDIAVSTPQNGVHAVLNRSGDAGEDGSPTQSWNAFISPNLNQIRLNLSTDKTFCLDLTNGVDSNRNPLQIWECTAGNTNQEWTYAPLA
ncbi:carbohydrate-binding module family 13 protein [Mycena metata]|uniref:Carbohydrate-binding module family 13 protein n=1 Tax=Mycena metata TaxID=1033252 RepID=A0AAD7MK11_9AGAR|nr:carbohydrate-binding module family 13 protein [Mycena metata]